MAPWMKRGFLLVLAFAACAKRETLALDAGADSVFSDTAPIVSDGPISLTVDFAVENCPSLDATTLTCSGHVPLTVRFAPLATTTVTKYLWDFGDTPAKDPNTAPSHTYGTPGVYSVRIIATGVGGGVVTKTHAGFIVALANPIGSPCESNSHCEEGLCLCPARASCATEPTGGMCAAKCPSGLCAAGQVCANLLTATPPQGEAEWQTSLCLAECDKDSDCVGGLRCRTLPGPAGDTWVHGCFSDIPGDIGDSCMDTSGNLRDDLCVGGLCANLGAMGLCSAYCPGGSCPPGLECTLFGDGRKLCLRPCASSFTCDHDPLLTCVVPGTGALGYRLPSPTTALASSYCAPRPCVSDDTCLPTGMCMAETGGGHCVRR
jgi:PKD repeat protein